MSELSNEREVLSPNVRVAVPEDAEAIIGIQYRAWLETYPRIVEELDESMVRNWFEIAEGGLQGRTERLSNKIAECAPNAAFFVAEERGEIKGHIIVGMFSEVNQGDHGHVVSVYSLEDAQSDTESRLLETGLKWLDAANNTVSMLVVEEDLEKLQLCHEYGFMEMRKLPRDERTPFRRDIVMPEIELVRLPAPIPRAAQDA